MTNEIDIYSKFKEPNKSCLLALKKLILSLDHQVTHEIKYGMPFFCYKNKMFCYLWIDKKLNEPYIGFVEGNRMNHPDLEKGERSRMKIYRVKPAEDLKVDEISILVNTALDFYRKGIIKIG